MVGDVEVEGLRFPRRCFWLCRKEREQVRWRSVESLCGDKLGHVNQGTSTKCERLLMVIIIAFFLNTEHLGWLIFFFEGTVESPHKCKCDEE